jgi:hypothetical protein
MFHPRSGLFSSRILHKNRDEKLNLPFSCYLWFPGASFSSLNTVDIKTMEKRLMKKMKEYLTKICAGSGIRKNFIPDPGSKKASDP